MTEYDDETLRTKTDEFLEFNQVLREYRWREIRPYLSRSPILDVGCGHTYMVEQLSKIVTQDHMTKKRKPRYMVIGIDPDEEGIKRAKKIAPNVDFYLGKMEDTELGYKFKLIICSHVIEHVIDPFRFLKKCHDDLASGGKIIITCPNALSLHKRVSQIAGQSELYQLSPTDEMQGHVQIFDQERLKSLVEAAGFEIEVSKGIMLKPFPNAMMSDLVSRRFADALYEIGKDPALTDYCSSLLIVARPR